MQFWRIGEKGEQMKSSIQLTIPKNKKTLCKLHIWFTGKMGDVSLLDWSVLEGVTLAFL